MLIRYPPIPPRPPPSPPPPPIIMVNKAHISYQEYKGHTKWLSLKSIYLTKKKKYIHIFGMTLLHAHAQYTYVVNAKYQKFQ